MGSSIGEFHKSSSESVKDIMNIVSHFSHMFGMVGSLDSTSDIVGVSLYLLIVIAFN